VVASETSINCARAGIAEHSQKMAIKMVR
jgi:hypothetical protein